MFRKMFLLAFCLFLVFTVQVRSEDITAEEAKIKAVVKQAFITRRKAYANTVEHGGQKYDGKKPTEAFDELAEYVSDSKGLLKYFKNLINLKDANEQLHFAKVRKWRFKDFDFKSINIDNDTANVEVNIYDEVTTSVGGSISVTHVLDKYDNTIESKVSEYQPHDLITPGGDNHKITLEKVNNKWRIIHDAWDFLPEYRP